MPRLPLRCLLAVLSAAALPARAADLTQEPIDFSSAGYAGGGVALPAVPARITVAPTGGDDTRAIQGAIDAVARLPLDAQGFRGAVALQAGTYRLAGGLKIRASGVVLRGHDTVLVATGQSRRTLIDVLGSGAPARGPAFAVAAATVPAGARVLPLASVDGLAVGRRILVRRPCTQEWISALGMDKFAGNYAELRLDWIPGSRDLEWERTITALDPAAKTITVDAPLTTALEKKFGGGTVRPLTWVGRISQVGVEGLTLVSDFDANHPNDEEHSWIAISLDRVEDAWVRNVTARHFVTGCVWVGHEARAVTVEDCANREPEAEAGSWRRLGFYVDGQQVLVLRCATEDGRHDFAAGLCAAGPNVFLECSTVRAQVDIGPFESWSSGALYDRLSIGGAGLSFQNIGPLTQGAGWTSANNVVWNTAMASLFKSDDPPGAANRIVVDPGLPSLYRAQLAARGGQAAVAALAPLPLPADPSGLTAFDPGSLPAPAAATVHPLSLAGGYFVVDGQALFGTSMSSALWKGQLVPGRERETGTSPTRWAPGRSGLSLTADLRGLVAQMGAERASIYWAFPGLWYDRRREEHLITRRTDGDAYGPFFESPWRRAGRGQAWDGLSQYDLTKFNPWYFSRMREMADDCAAQGRIFACQLYCNHNVEEASAHFAEYAWRSANNINGTGFPEPPPFENAAQNRIHIADQFYDIHDPVRRPLHELYIRHTLDVLGDSPNLLVTLGYQFAGPLPFQQFFIDTVAAWEKEHHRQVRIVLQTSKAVTDAILADPVRAAEVDAIDTRYWQYLADGQLFAPDGLGKLAFRELRTNAFGRDAAIPTKADYVYRQVREYRDRFPDKAIIAGTGGFGPIPVLMAGGSEYLSAEGQAAHAGGEHNDAALDDFVARHLASDLPAMRPVDGLVPGAWSLGAEGRGWLVYSPSGDTIRFARDPGLAGAQALWFNPRNGQTEAARGEGARFTKPTAEAWLLWIKA
ncbi:MAG TPA: DUF6298 domain-containing protein [Opitutaceae bacterium]|jgi:hypothetical protein|nr:DUF6298 domain-containing protein [Opitutaceae bacterium]